MVLPSHETNVLFHSLADILEFITAARYKGKYIYKENLKPPTALSLLTVVTPL